MQYRTEIYVADDRYVCLQLPDFIPAGRAVVTVVVTPPAADPPPDPRADAADDEAVEWWDEFDAEDDPRRR